MSGKEMFCLIAQGYIDQYLEENLLYDTLNACGFSFDKLEADPLTVAVEKFLNQFGDYTVDNLIELADEGYIDIYELGERIEILTVEDYWDVLIDN